MPGRADMGAARAGSLHDKHSVGQTGKVASDT